MSYVYNLPYYLRLISERDWGSIFTYCEQGQNPDSCAAWAQMVSVSLGEYDLLVQRFGYYSTEAKHQRLVLSHLFFAAFTGPADRSWTVTQDILSVAYMMYLTQKEDESKGELQSLKAEIEVFISDFLDEAKRFHQYEGRDVYS